MADQKKFEDVYNKFFSKNKPNRSVVLVKELPKGALVEVEAVAVEGEAAAPAKEGAKEAPKAAAK